MRLKFFKRAFKTGLIVIGLSICLFLTATLMTKGFECSGSGVSAEEANRDMHQNFLLPPSAKDVNYLSDIWHSEVEFAISETDFVNWCQSRGWRTISMAPDELASYQSIFGGERRFRIIQDGLRSMERQGGPGFYGVFDRTLRRASVQYSTH